MTNATTETPTDASTNDQPEEPLPFNAEYEIGVQEAGYPDEWEFYHPKAKTTQEAEELAKKEAKSDGMADPMVYQTTGPYKPDDPIRVGEEMIEQVFSQ